VPTTSVHSRFELNPTRASVARCCSAAME
jgi:hypothetical protein